MSPSPASPPTPPGSPAANDTEALPGDGKTQDLRRRAIRGGAITIASQFAKLAITMISTVVLARLLTPNDFGLVAMVAAVTGVLALVQDSGLSMATVQKSHVTRELISSIFWINVALGSIVSLLCVVLAPVLAALYREQRLSAIGIAIASTFIIDAIGAQHMALLRRQLRMKAIAAVDILSTAVGVAVSIAMALVGFGYWALVGMRIATSFASTLGCWIAESWRPSRPAKPRHGSGVGSMLRFGGFLSGFNLVNYVFRNIDNVLIGWRWGAGPLGMYQKAYGLLMLPINQVNSPISGVAIAALSRIQDDPPRQRRYFIGGYSITVAVVVPIVVGGAVFADAIIRFLLGDQWLEAVDIFRYLAPAALIGALLNPFGWLFISTGRVDRQFRAALVWTPVVTAAFAIGLPYGPEGVAIAYSVISALLAIPLCFYAVHGTTIKPRDIVVAIRLPMLAGLAAAGAALVLDASWPHTLPAAVRAIGGCAFVVLVYALTLLTVLGQWRHYRALLHDLWPNRFAP